MTQAELVTLVLSSESGVGLVRFDCGGAERVPSSSATAAGEVFVEGSKIDETFGRLGTGITWQEWKNGGNEQGRGDLEFALDFASCSENGKTYENMVPDVQIMILFVTFPIPGLNEVSDAEWMEHGWWSV